MSRRGRRQSEPTYGGALPWLLALPARMRVRPLLIAGILALVMGTYGHLLLTAPPMPPHKAPTVDQEIAETSRPAHH
ncbi:hypothetical protein SRB5_45070 [Streptomyces sp. RB5]|uniref:Uncharacterized protein n=1 Tax=Streptomyces smaragdinus TaxID=2585196 RepID=A0A7K0CM51_9ACTN|nr:hypothetical protein [Streptomyces smaragdinus]MQY14343.1 hypothetical protein [Streptomyces smaragdinus]